METRKQEITRVASKLFKEKGYSAVTMRDLASAVGVKASSLYNHISSKQDILQSIVISIAEEFTKGMELILKQKKSSIEKLEDLIALHIKIASENPNGLASLNSDWMHLKDQLNYYLELRNTYEENFRTIIQQGIQQSEIKPINVEVIVFSMLSTLRTLYLWIPKKENLNQQLLVNELTITLIKGLTTN